MDLVYSGFMEINIHQAKTHLSRLLQRVAAGEEVTIARSGVPVARLVAVEPEKKKVRPLGMDRGRIWIADNFDAPLPDDLLKAFYGGELPELEPKRRTRKR
jgi:prevent-host-death family protein